MSEKKGLFNISPNCNPEAIAKVKLGKKIFYVSLLTLLPLSMIFIVGLWYGTDTTVIFRNDDKILGYRTGEILSPEQYPTTPFPVDFNGTDVIYAEASNISSIYAGAIGFLMVNQEFMQVLMNNATLLIFLMFVLQTNFNTYLNPNGNANGITYGLENIPITPYIRNHTVTMAFGNFGEEANHDVKFKVSSGICIIPFFSINIELKGIYQGNTLKKFQTYGFWNDSFNIDNFDRTIAKHGVWEISIEDIIFNAYASMGIVTQDFSYVPNMTSTPITFTGELKRSYSLADIFTPITKYSTTIIEY